jgi:hypothetical protein
VIDQEGLDPRSGENEAAQRPECDHVRDRRLPKDDRDLAEELAPPDPSTLGAVDDHGRLAVEDA